MTKAEKVELQYLRQHLKSLEEYEREHNQLKKLLESATQNKPLNYYTNEIVLYAQPDTGRIVDANNHAIEFLGYPQEILFTLTIDELEVPNSQGNSQTYIESSIEIQVYDTHLWHHDGYKQTVVVRKWLITKNNTPILCYTAEDTSLHAQFLHELSRREDPDYQFREKLKNLNEIALELGMLNSFNDVCRQGVESGIERLGFDRLSLWFLDSTKTKMYGTFGVDEEGNVRDERGHSWSFVDSYLVDFTAGKREPIITHDSAPLYNQNSELVGYGWHISVPVVDGGEFIGHIGADNFLNKRALKNYEPELLRLYGVTIGHLASRQREQETIRKLSSAVQHSSSMIVVLNKQQIIEFANDTFCQKSGYSLQEILQQDASMLFPADTFQSINKQISSGQSWHGELINQTKAGSPYEAFVSISPVRLGNTIENFVIVQEDISMLNQARQKELALQLEQERASLLESFVTDIGHEFKTPLSIIHTSNFIVGQIQDKDIQEKHIEYIQTQVEILSQMLDDILEIVTLTSTLELKTEKVWLANFVGNIINNAKPIAQEKELAWDIQLDSHITLQADADKLARVVHEILKNAIQFTPAQGKVSVSLKQYEKQVGIIIQDTGVGIPADEFDKIFDRFYRVDKARKKRHAGLGLAIAKLLIEAHHGEIKVDGVVGKGSRFEILLPLGQRAKEV